MADPHWARPRRDGDAIRSARAVGCHAVSRISRRPAGLPDGFFVAGTGLPFGRWRTLLRIQSALPLLAAGHPVGRVASRVGYETASAFVATFRRETGPTPSAYFTRPPARGAGAGQLVKAPLGRPEFFCGRHDELAGLLAGQGRRRQRLEGPTVQIGVALALDDEATLELLG
jgi:hypothetical protein